MKTILRSFAAFLAGFALAFVLVVAVEGFSAVVHPFPEGMGTTPEEMCRHVARYPQWVLAAVVPMWACTAFAATWTAGRLGNRAAAAVLGLVLTALVVVNIVMLPYTPWFKVVMPAAVAAAVVCGFLAAARRLPAASAGARA